MTPLIVIQARLGSKRLPSKILLPLGEKPVLQHVVERCQRTGYPVCVATVPQDGQAISTALSGVGGLSHPIRVSAYDEPDGDVLARFARLEEHLRPILGPRLIVRITADCPLVDPQLIEAAVQAVRDGADYAGNTVERHWPRGCDVECFTTELLSRAHELATDPYDREHVTPWMQRWATSPIALPASVRPVEARTEWRWTLDTLRDKSWLVGLFNEFPDPSLEQAAMYSRLYPPPVD